MKKVLALLMAALLVMGLLAACGDSGSSAGNTGSSGAAPSAGNGEIVLDGTWPEEKIDIGVLVFSASDSSTVAFMQYGEYLSKYFNIEFHVSEDITAAEQELAFIDTCGNAGYKGIIALQNVSGDEAVKEAASFNMYYAMAVSDMTVGSVENEYYVGGFTYDQEGSSNEHTGEYEVGYQMGYDLAKGGAKHILYSNGFASMGVKLFVDRQEGFADGVAAAKAEGAETQFDLSTDLIEGFPGTESYSAAQTVALEKDYDAIAISHSGAAAWFQPISMAGKDGQVTIACLGAVDEMYKDAMANGLVSFIGYDCEEVVYGTYIPLLINAILGDADLARPDGAPAAVFVNRWMVNNSEDYNAILDYHESDQYFVTAEDVAKCIKAYNPDASYQTICDVYGGLTLENAVSMTK